MRLSIPRSGPNWLLLACAALPLAAQTTQIGGGTCSSATLNGAYAFTLTGRQVTSAGNFTSVFQADGAATFDGLNKVTVTFTTDTLPAVGVPLTWSGSYTLQANCIGAVTISTGGSAALNISTYNNGTDFLVAGTDSTYTYSGSGSSQSSGCSTSTLSGVYTYSGTGYMLANSAVSGIAAAAGLFQFDGQGNVTANLTVSSAKPSSPLTLTGTYSASANCLGSANLTDASMNPYVMSFSITNMTAANGAFDGDLAESAKLILSGSGHAIFGQPTSTTSPAIETPNNMESQHE